MLPLFQPNRHRIIDREDGRLASSTRLYPGLTGIPTAHPKWDSWAITPTQQHELRQMLEHQLRDDLLGHANFESFFADLTYLAHLYRGWAALAEESRPVVRRANIRKRMSWLQRKSRVCVLHVTLSAVNVGDLRRIQDTSGCDEQAGLQLLLQRLEQGGTGKGRRPLDEIHHLIDGIAQAYMDAFNRNRSCTKEGDFERIAICTLTVASEGRRTSIRPHLEQYCSRAEIEEERSYFRDNGTSVVRPRSFAPPRMTARGSK